MVTWKTVDSRSKVLLFLPDGAGPFPLICQTPLLGRLEFLEDLYFEKRIARFFARQGFACAVLERPIFEFNEKRGLEQLPEYLHDSIERNRSALDDLLAQPEIDRTRVGTFGMSFGSIVNCLWAADDTRLTAHVFALGGAGIPEIFMASQDPLMKSYREAALKATKLDAENLLAELKEHFVKDPRHLQSPFPPGSCLLMLALFDKVVPFKRGMEMRKILGMPRTVFLPLGHYTSILTLPFLKRQAASFFKKKFFHA